MTSEKALLVFAVIAAVLSIFTATFIYFYTDNIKNTWFTGFATDTATVNLTVESAAAINFTNRIINWGSGRFFVGVTNATLNTGNSSAPVYGGNWTNNTAGLLLQNDGNVNITLTIGFGKNSSAFVGGTSPSYAFNLSMNESSSCRNVTVGFTFGIFYEVNSSDINNATNDGVRACDQFLFKDSTDSLRMDIRLIVPSDAKTGALGDTITATVAENTTI